MIDLTKEENPLDELTEKIMESFNRSEAIDRLVKRHGPAVQDLLIERNSQNRFVWDVLVYLLTDDIKLIEDPYSVFRIFDEDSVPLLEYICKGICVREIDTEISDKFFADVLLRESIVQDDSVGPDEIPLLEPTYDVGWFNSRADKAVDVEVENFAKNEQAD